MKLVSDMLHAISFLRSMTVIKVVGYTGNKSQAPADILEHEPNYLPPFVPGSELHIAVLAIKSS